MDLQTSPLPGDVEYFLDAALEHEELDATAHLTLKLYAPRVELMGIIDEPHGHDGPARMHRRLSTCDRLTDLADGILCRIPIETRAPLAWAGVRHVKHWVTGTANMMAWWAQEDMIKGGCSEPYKRARTATEHRRIAGYVTTPRQRRRLYSPDWIRRYVRLSPDKARLRAMGDRTRARVRGLDWSLARHQADRIAEMLEAQHEHYRRTNQRMIQQFKYELRPKRDDAKKRRKVVIKAAATAETVIGRDNLNRWNTGQVVTIMGHALAFEVARSGSSATLGHGGMILTAVDPSSRRKLANMCLYHEETPSLDQLTAIALAVSAGEEAEILATANLSNVTELGSKHPLIEGHASVKREQSWWLGGLVRERNEEYWQATKPVWLEALGTHVLGRDWKVLA